MSPDQENIIAGEKVSQVLALASREHSRIRITKDPEGFPYYSNLREVQPKQLLVNTPQPIGMEDDYLVDTPVELFFPLHSRLYFIGRSVFLGVRQSPTEPLAFVLKSPEQLVFQRERRVLRVIPPPGMPVSCLAINGQPTANQVKVVNISQEGICLSFPNPPTIPDNKILHAIKLKLSGSTYLTLDGAVSYQLQDEMNLHCVGLMWEPLTKPQFTALRNYVQLILEKVKK